MSASGTSMAVKRSRLLDWRVWLGLGITVGALWLALRDVSFEALWRDIARANLWILLGISVPANLAAMWVRALRWRHLTDAIAPIGKGPLFRATAVGFMANNVFPLRIGELLRAWYLGRETGVDKAALLGTVILERVIDSMIFVGMAAVLLGLYGARGADSGAIAVGVPLLIGSIAPIGFVVWLRFAPDSAIGLAHAVLRPVLPDRVTQSLEGILRRVADGLGSITGGRHLFWIAFHSALIWLVISLLPFLAGVWALDVDLGSPGRTLAAGFTTLVAVGIAIAIPSAPGFFGPYHYACRKALEGFGVPDATAVALGTLVHAVFWITITALGLAVLRLRGTSFGEIDAAAGDAGQVHLPDRR
jgi:hypothetical protein